MSGSARWKEERIRQEVYLEHLRHTEMSPNGAGRNGDKLQVQTSVPLLPQPLANRSGIPVLNRRKKNEPRVQPEEDKPESMRPARPGVKKVLDRVLPGRRECGFLERYGKRLNIGNGEE
jgi:hypothetical protein